MDNPDFYVQIMNIIDFNLVLCPHIDCYNYLHVNNPNATHGILTPYPWHIGPPTHGISTPLPMVYRPPVPWYFDPPAHGISTPLPMVYQTLSNGIMNSSFGRNEGGSIYHEGVQNTMTKN